MCFICASEAVVGAGGQIISNTESKASEISHNPPLTSGTDPPKWSQTHPQSVTIPPYVTPLTVLLSQLFKYCFNDVSFTEAQKKYE